MNSSTQLRKRPLTQRSKRPIACSPRSIRFPLSAVFFNRAGDGVRLVFESRRPSGVAASVSSSVALLI